MIDLSDKSCLVIDSGLFPHVAIKMAESFGSVKYFAPWVIGGFPTAKKRMVGVGLPGVERIYHWLNRLPEVDVVIAPDVYTFDEVNYLRTLGMPVWGAGKAEALEIERWKTRELMIELGMPVVPAELCTGVTALRAYLAEQTEQVWIKRSITRGDGETQKCPNPKLIEDWIVEQEDKLGPRKEQQEFIVEQHVPGIETGYDGINIDGRYGPIGGYGYELKDEAYVLRVCPYEGLPRPIRYCNDAFADALGKLGCRGFYSNEIRVGEDGTPYLIDPTVRAGRPPSELYIEIFENWAEVIYQGARGIMVPLRPVAAYGVEIVLKSDRVRDRYLAVDFPPKLARWIKIGNSCVIEGQWWVIPQDDAEFGSAIGIGESVDEAVAMAVEHAEAVEALGINFKEGVADSLKECIEKGREAGIDF